jgi:hypothetical protein
MMNIRTYRTREHASPVTQPVTVLAHEDDKDLRPSLLDLVGLPQAMRPALGVGVAAIQHIGAVIEPNSLATDFAQRHDAVI